MYIRKAMRSVISSAFICASAIFVIAPGFTPIPITFQLVAVLTSAALLGPIGSTVSCFIYLILGAMGLPVFAGAHSGFSHMLGATGGYLLGFMPCAYITGKLSFFFYKELGTFFMQFASLFVAMAIGTLILYFFGSLYFYIITGNTVSKTLVLAVLPFLWVDLLKITVAAYISRQILQIFDRQI